MKNVRDARSGTGAYVNCLSKGRKQRITPLTSATAAVMDAWLAEQRGAPTDRLSRAGTAPR